MPRQGWRRRGARGLSFRPQQLAALLDPGHLLESRKIVIQLRRAMFYKLAKAGMGPRVVRIGTKQLVSEEEAAAWRAERTAANAAA
jgi:predicted DNA-binding transcriptional regulator AlpA